MNQFLSPDPAVLAVLCVIVAVAWWIFIGVRAARARALEVVAIIALGVYGVASFGYVVLQQLMLMK